MITENGKKFIARNFGSNNCYALEAVVPCSLYIKGELLERVLTTASLLTGLTSGMAEYVITPTGKFTLDQAIAANDGTNITLWDSMIDEPYCIPGAPPVTPPVTPPYVPPTTPPYTPPVTPTGAKDFEILNPVVTCDSYNCGVRLNIRNNSNSSTSIYMRLDVDGTPKIKRHVYLLKGATKAQTSLFHFAGIRDGWHNLTIAVGKVADTDTYTHRFLVGAPSIEPPPATPTGVPGVTIAVDKTTCRVNQQIRLTGMYTSEDGRLLVGHDIGFHGYLKGTKKYLGKTKTTSGGRYSFTYTPAKDGTWQFTAYDDYTSPKVTVTVTSAVTPSHPPAYVPPVTAVEPPEQIKNWIVANYGDGTRVTTDGWRRLSDAEMANALAPLPSGYTKADITGGTISWAMDNPNWKTQTICEWISAIGITNLTEDHGRYVYQLAKGRTSLSDRIYNLLSPKPSKPSGAIVTEDNGRGVFQYAKGRKTTGNKITGCDF